MGMFSMWQRLFYYPFRRGKLPSLLGKTDAESRQRHIKISCWRTCDECTADRAVHCDSTTKTGACRTCEAEKRSCTKYTSAIPDSTPQHWTGPAARPWQISSVDEETVTTIQQKQTKRKAPISSNKSSETTQKSKRRVWASQQLLDHGLGRAYDPLGGQAYVSPTVKKAAVSSWLEEQQQKNRKSLPTVIACFHLADIVWTKSLTGY